ncbi:hydantoinase/oxoprolinase family protein [Parasphingopyxis algicola]|uniref:hydantoinase/oxoprolinase N-terminal domain-containing protein n=1 Tax=Parasphingopyxis algicola TaxID=2026624 RepID=UPI0015A1D082|nr:hydantoinase/oxoprolinase family protein [Parasphingopyxis algicola]QLC24888.1 hydantoinase/oxoprolinase family protein [Parasphingopyxis algicola]
MRIGVDVGGTNTDAALMDGNDVVETVKSPTGVNIGDGIANAIGELMTKTGSKTPFINAVMLGTTQFTNTFVERAGLDQVAVLRLSLPANRDLGPFAGWPDSLAAAVNGGVYPVHGGYEYDGIEIAPLDESEIAAAARDMAVKGLNRIAISSVFAPINDAMEKTAADIVADIVPEAAITLSSRLGRIGLLERENAAIINAVLATTAKRVTTACQDALSELGIEAPLFFSQNDGTLMTAADARDYPVRTFASGPTNSLRGAAFLSGIEDGIVADIGGTTTDVGVVAGGFPRQSGLAVEIGGVQTNFRMPDIVSIGLGGGSHVELGDPVRIGPRSAGHRLMEEAMLFGGTQLTATDIAAAAGRTDIGDRDRLASLPEDEVRAADRHIQLMAETAIDRIKTSADPAPVILVGGGAILLSHDLAGASRLIVPDHAAVANAVGAALAQVGGEVDQVFAFDAIGREQALKEACTLARERAVAAGARARTVELVDLEEVPLTYLPGGAVRVRAKMVGELDLEKTA